MEYERIHKIQTGIISPSKLRMKLIGPHHQRKKEGSNSNSSRTSPSKLQDTEFVKNSLLATQNGDLDEENVPSLAVPSVKISETLVLAPGHGDQDSYPPKGLMLNGNADAAVPVKMQQFSKGDIGNSYFFRPGRTIEDENLDYDSTSSFEFHKGDRTVHNPKNRSFSRPMPSKWNDAEKWITNRQNMLPNSCKKTHFQNQGSRFPGMDIVRIAPESVGYDNKPSVKRVDVCQPLSQVGLEKFSYVPSGSHSFDGQPNGENALVDMCTQSKDLTEVDNNDFPCAKSSINDPEGVPGVRAVSMRDTGTEMTPIPSQEPSQTTTPVGATTPLRSPNSSIPSTPRRVEPAPTLTEQTTRDSLHPTENSKKELSEQEFKMKTRKEIVALGVQLGKMNIATWASKEEKEMNATTVEAINNKELERIEFAKRAAAWEEAEKSKHMARFKREEIKIQAWESRRKAKLEAKMRRIEAQIEQTKAQAQAKMVKKIAMARQRSEEKRTAAEAMKNRQVEKIAAQADSIRHTGRIPSSPFICCGWS